MKRNYKELVKDLVLAGTRNYTRLSKINDNFGINAINELGEDGLRKFLKSKGFKLVKVTDYLIFKK